MSSGPSDYEQMALREIEIAVDGNGGHAAAAQHLAIAQVYATLATIRGAGDTPAEPGNRHPAAGPQRHPYANNRRGRCLTCDGEWNNGEHTCANCGLGFENGAITHTNYGPCSIDEGRMGHRYAPVNGRCRICGGKTHPGP